MRWQLVAALCLVSTLAAPAASQCTPLQYAARTWVDPVFGNDTTGVVNFPNRPYLTLGRAIADTASDPAVAAGGEGLVTALPGIYSWWTNTELTPVVMRDRVHVVGIGAKECVLRGSQGVTTLFPCIYPFAGTSGAPIPKEIGLWFQNTVASGDSEASIEGFTIEGAQVQAFFSSEAGIRGRISNCVFDMRSPSDAIGGPEFGVLINNVLVNVIGGVAIYQFAEPKIFNNTFILATRLPDGTIQSAVPFAVGICDTNWGNPNPSGPKDPDRECRGVSEPSIQNNILRDLPFAKRTAMLGIDRTDTAIGFGTGTFNGSTNAFDPGTVGPNDATNLFFCKWMGLPPSARVNTAIDDPRFAGEYVGVLKLAAGEPYVNLTDFRLIPGSPMTDMGSSPFYSTPGACSAQFRAVNGTTYVDHPLGAWEHGSFDFDGEGHGNLRTVAGSTAAAETDIGFDESDSLLVAGSYANNSKSHNQSWFPPFIDNSDTNRYYISPIVTGLSVSMSLSATTSAFPAPISFNVYPGLGPILAPFVPFPGMAPSFLWLMPGWISLPTFPMAVQTVPDVLNGIPRPFNMFKVSLAEVPGTVTFFNEQAFHIDNATGLPVTSAPLNRLSNSQSEHF